MKKLIYTLLLTCIHAQFSQAQFMRYTGKIWSISTSIQPITTFRQELVKTNLNAFSGSFEIGKKLFTGIYPTIGYTYTKSNGDTMIDARTFDRNKLYFTNAHSINAGVLIQKHLFTIQSRRVAGGCFVQSLSFFVMPEYNFMFVDGPRVNKSKGEFALKTGICLVNTHSAAIAKSFLWGVYYRKGFSPILSYKDEFGEQNLYKNEIGIQLRILFRQRYNFLQ